GGAQDGVRGVDEGLGGAAARGRADRGGGGEAVRVLLTVAAIVAALALAACGDGSAPSAAAGPAGAPATHGERAAPPATEARTGASALRPPLRRLEDDRGEAHTSGCHLKTSGRTR